MARESEDEKPLVVAEGEIRVELKEVSLSHNVAEDKEAVSKLDVDKEADEHASDTLKEKVDAAAGTEPDAGIPARRLSYILSG